MSVQPDTEKGFCIAIPSPYEFGPENLIELRHNLERFAETTNSRIRYQCIKIENIFGGSSPDDFDLTIVRKCHDDAIVPQLKYRFSTIDRAKVMLSFGNYAGAVHSWLLAMSTIVFVLQKVDILALASTNTIQCYFKSSSPADHST